MPGWDNLVTLSMSRLLLRSIRRSKCFKKSAPSMGTGTAAIKNFQLKWRLSPKSMFINLVPYVWIFVLFAANSSNASGCNFSEFLGIGTQETSDPESTKNFKCDLLSKTYKRRDLKATGTSVAEMLMSIADFSFPSPL